MESVVVERDWLITIVVGENHTKLVKKIRNHTQKMLLIPHLRFSQVSSATCKVHTLAQRFRINPLNNFMIRLCFCKINTYIHTYIQPRNYNQFHDFYFILLGLGVVIGSPPDSGAHSTSAATVAVSPPRMSLDCFKLRAYQATASSSTSSSSLFLSSG